MSAWLQVQSTVLCCGSRKHQRQSQQPTFNAIPKSPRHSSINLPQTHLEIYPSPPFVMSTQTFGICIDPNGTQSRTRRVAVRYDTGATRSEITAELLGGVNDIQVYTLTPPEEGIVGYFDARWYYDDGATRRSRPERFYIVTRQMSAALMRGAAPAQLERQRNIYPQALERQTYDEKLTQEQRERERERERQANQAERKKKKEQEYWAQRNGGNNKGQRP